MRDTKGDFVRAAFISALIGGAVLAFTMVIPAAGNAHRMWPGTQFAAYPFIGHQVFEPGLEVWPMVLGTVVHFVISFGWALAFVFSVRKLTRVQTVLLSIPAGLVVWLVMHQIVLRVIQAEAVVQQMSPIWGALQHVGFMLSIALTLVLMQPQNWRFRRTRRQLAA